ncbi:hypothetical protein [Palaeococcus ferrophilus]|uniref:hypothetical protein n=1 Tax=Palaeococcus ferrophilus TaxID=83868 RepID=UPI00064F2A57|nr:hypothetical protein [Palaeococcus ferrophilus]
MVEEIMVIAENPTYHSIIRSHYVNPILSGIQAVGMEPVKVLVRVETRTLGDGRRVLIPLTYLAVDDSQSYILFDEEELITSIVQKVAENLTEKLKGRGLLVYVPEEVLRIEFTTGDVEERGKLTVLVDCPEEYREELERFAKGVAIHLREKGVDVNNLVLSTQVFHAPIGKKVDLKLDFAVTVKPEGLKYSREAIEELIHGIVQKYGPFLIKRLNLGAIIMGNIHVIVPGEDRASGIVISQKERILEEVEELTQSEEIQELVTILR